MRVNDTILKLFIRLIIVLILFVVLFMITTVLYSARYWSDIYQYTHPNITIKSIVKISEINNIDEADFTTEGYTTTESDNFSTIDDKFDFSIDDFTIVDKESKRKRRNIVIEDTNKDYNEVPRDVVVDYVFNIVSTKIIKDLIDESKLVPKTQDDVEIFEMNRTDHEPEMNQKMSVQKCSSNDTSDAKDVVFPWIAAIFVKVNNSEQFDYYCDGALISNTVVVTAARCVWSATAAAATSVDDVLVILGKTSLQAVANSEKVLRVKKIKIHEDFKMADSEIINDLAVLNLEEPVKFGKSIRPACLYNDTSGSGNDTSENGNDTSWTDCDDALTTGWRVSGELTQIHFEKEKSKDCKDTGATFCAVYGNDITVCPSHAGLFIVRRQKTWYLKGLRSSDPTNKGICFERTVWYTSLEDHYTWIQEYD